MTPLAITMAIATGFILPIQSAMNTRLTASMKSNFSASFVAFLIGAIFLGVIVAVRGDAVTSSANVPWWAYTGGLCGILALISVIFIFPHVGAVETVVLPVGGKIISGLLIDHFGWFNSPVQHISVQRIIGGILAAAGMIIAVYARGRRSHVRPRLIWRIMGILVGVYASIQAAVNGFLGASLKAPISAGFITYASGAVILLLLVLVTRQWPRGYTKGPWWMWLGGPIGAIFVVGMATLQPSLGLGVTLLIVLIGQLLGSLTIDNFALFGAKKQRIGLAQVGGVLTLAIGMYVYYLW
ncbi:MAG: DMT family transporter [Actinomycetaceae bacterium]|nr:DMT family transporter [Actinomycetaceae bacterium]